MRTTSESQTAASSAASADAAAHGSATAGENETVAGSAASTDAIAPAGDTANESETAAGRAIATASASDSRSAAPATTPLPCDAGDGALPRADTQPAASPPPAGLHGTIVERAAPSSDLQLATAGDRYGTVAGSAFRTWLRYLVPLTLLSAIALSPLVALAARVRAPADAAAARPVIQLGWTLLAAAWLGQLLLVGGAAAMLTEPPSQLRAFTRGLLQLSRAVLPCLVAALAVAVGSLALVLPGLILLVLLSLTAASRERGLPAPLLDSIAAARRQLPAVALAVLALFAIDAAIGLVAYRSFLLPLPAKPTPTQLAAVRDFVRAVVLALVVLSPLPATVLATLRVRIGR